MLSWFLLGLACRGDADLRPMAVRGEPADPPPAPAPATPEEAARQLAAWLVDPAAAPVPALLTPISRIEVRMHCGTCDDEPAVTTRTVIGVDGLTGLADELRRRTLLDKWNVEPLLRCEGECCTYPPSPAGTHHVVELVEVCVGLSADGTPIDYTRIGTHGA